MNKKRLSKISVIIDELNSIQARLTDIKGDEEIAHDAIPESLQGTDEYDRSENAIEYLDEADGALQEAIDALEGIE